MSMRDGGPSPSQPTHDWRDRFSDHYDGEMDDAERAAFEAWLAADAEGRAEYEAFRSSLEMLHGLDVNRAPRDFVREVTQDIQRQSRGAFFANDTWWLGFRVPYEAFAALILALFAALYLFGGAGSPRSYAVSDAPPSQPASQPPQSSQPSAPSGAIVPGAAELGGLAAGAESQLIDVTLAADAELGLVSRMLRGDGFATRPALHDGRDAVLVSVPTSQLERFAERLFVATGQDLKALLRAQVKLSQRAVTVRLVGGSP